MWATQPAGRGRCLLACQVGLTLLAVIATYHLFVQLGWIADPCQVSCQVNSLDDFWSVLTRPVTCATGPKVLGLPLPAYSAALAVTVLLMTLWPQKRRVRRDPNPDKPMGGGLEI
ncbi:MAG: disulfide bond formation protein B [Parachlamydiales bacterium]